MSGTWWRNPLGVAVLVVVVLAGNVIAPPGRVALDLAGYLLLVCPALAVAAVRRVPVLVLVLTTACLLAYLIRGYPGVTATVPVLIAMYATVDAGRRLAAVTAVVVTLAGGVAGQLVVIDPAPAAPDLLQNWFLLLGWLVAAGVAGETSRQRRENLDQVERRAVDAERTREEVACRRADEERLRIARELHDSLTHSISIIKVQAGVAVHLARKRGEMVPEALLAVQQASGEAMRELRATLEVLRTDGRAMTGLDRLETLIADVRDAGLSVTVRVSGRPTGLPAAVDLTAYRIVQEALTNVTRHAGPATATVCLDHRGHELAIRVEDDGRGGAGGAFVPGVGLTGMRERVVALGGSLRTGPDPSGGFRVHAVLPLTEFT